MMRRVASGSGSTNLFHAIVASEKTKNSAATIAWNKFVEPLPDATLRIMSTYYAAQYLFALLALAASSRKAAAARP